MRPFVGATAVPTAAGIVVAKYIVSSKPFAPCGFAGYPILWGSLFCADRQT